MPLPTSITTRLEYQHKSLLDIIEGLSDEHIHKRVIPEKWSIFENIVHLAISEHVFLHRLQRILTEDNPQLERYSAESDPFFNENCAKTTREVMQDLISTRRTVIATVHALREEDMPRTGEHPIYGKMNLLLWLNFFLLHEAHHLFTIFKLVPEVRNRN
ncbi:MAG TPA: DinB family protein [Chitinophagaceae bacterium]